MWRANHRDRNFTNAKLERRMRDIEESIGRYLLAMDTADRQEPVIAKARTERLQDKIAALKEQKRFGGRRRVFCVRPAEARAYQASVG
jgi:hypothetical protein